MPATFNFAQTIGAPAGTRQDLGSSGNLLNFKNVDSIGTSDYASNPIAAGNASYELWLQGHFTGTFNSISDVRFWMSTNFSPSTGLSVKLRSNQTSYVQPVNSVSSIATSTISSSDPGTTNVSISGSLSSSLSTSGYTDYLVMQLQTTASAPAGDTSLAVFTLSYLEN